MVKQKILFLILIIFVFLRIQDEWKDSKVHILNHMLNELKFHELVDIEKNPASFEPARLNKYRQYFQTVTQYIPSFFEAYGMLGFCYYYLGDSQKALLAYQKALEFNPQSLWFNYNAGVIYYHQGRYQEALDSFQKALKTNPSLNAEMVFKSKIYMDIVRQVEIDQPQLEQRLKEGYLLSAYGARLSELHIQKIFHSDQEQEPLLRLF